jgi:hypothetical protein
MQSAFHNGDKDPQRQSCIPNVLFIHSNSNLPVVSLCRLTLTSNFFTFCYTQTAQEKNLSTANLNSHWS